MDKKQKDINKTLQVILWLWFGTITSFVSVNVVNIARLETQYSSLNDQMNLHQKCTLHYYQQK